MIQTTDPQNELFTVVDEHDTILGYKTRRECHKNKSLIHRSINIAVFNDKEEILLQKRSKYKDTHPGKWTMSVGGHVAKGQTYEEAAIREMKEELGITSPLTLVKKYHHIEPNEQEMVVLYKAVYNGPFSPNYEEIDKVMFMKTNEIVHMTHKLTPCAKDSLRQLDLL